MEEESGLPPGLEPTGAALQQRLDACANKLEQEVHAIREDIKQRVASFQHEMEQLIQNKTKEIASSSSSPIDALTKPFDTLPSAVLSSADTTFSRPPPPDNGSTWEERKRYSLRWALPADQVLAELQRQQLSLTSSSPSPSLSSSSSSTPDKYKEEEDLLPQQVVKVEATTDFAAEEEDEFEFSKGAVFVVVEREDEEWWWGLDDEGYTGIFPRSFVRVLEGNVELLPLRTQQQALEKEEEERKRTEREEEEQRKRKEEEEEEKRRREQEEEERKKREREAEEEQRKRKEKEEEEKRKQREKEKEKVKEKEAGIVKAEAIANFEAMEADELAFNNGDVLQVQKRVDDRWWFGLLLSNNTSNKNSVRKTGIFPKNFVKVIVGNPEALPLLYPNMSGGVLGDHNNIRRRSHEEMIKQMTQQQQRTKHNEGDQKCFVRVEAIADFEALEEDEFGFHKGDIFRVVQREDETWWWAQVDEEEQGGSSKTKCATMGIFPKNFVKVLQGNPNEVPLRPDTEDTSTEQQRRKGQRYTAQKEEMKRNNGTLTATTRLPSPGRSNPPPRPDNATKPKLLNASNNNSAEQQVLASSASSLSPSSSSASTDVSNPQTIKVRGRTVTIPNKPLPKLPSQQEQENEGGGGGETHVKEEEEIRNGKNVQQSPNNRVTSNQRGREQGQGRGQSGRGRGQPTAGRGGRGRGLPPLPKSLKPTQDENKRDEWQMKRMSVLMLMQQRKTTTLLQMFEQKFLEEAA
ncbi:intersectin-2a isoform X1 [Balamuthia mandrillaris]